MRSKRSAAAPDSKAMSMRSAPSAASVAMPAWTSSSAPSATVTSQRRLSIASPRRKRAAFAISSALPAAVASGSFMSVIERRGSRSRRRSPPRRGFGPARGRPRACHEGARAGLHVEHQRAEPGGELLRQDRGGDEVDRLHRRGDVADGVEAAVGGGDVVGLADDGAADLAHHAGEGLGVGLGGVAGDGVELVERAAGMAEAAAGDHRHVGAAGGERRGEHQADIVADPAGRVLVDHRPRQVPGEHAAGVAHGAGQRHALVAVHAAEEDRHGEGGDLALGDDAGGQPVDEEADLLGRERAAVAFAGDDLLREHQ